MLVGLDDIDVPVVAVNPDFKPTYTSSFDAHGLKLGGGSVEFAPVSSQTGGILPAALRMSFSHR